MQNQIFPERKNEPTELLYHVKIIYSLLRKIALTDVGRISYRYSNKDAIWYIIDIISYIVTKLYDFFLLLPKPNDFFIVYHFPFQK